MSKNLIIINEDGFAYCGGCGFQTEESAWAYLQAEFPKYTLEHIKDGFTLVSVEHAHKIGAFNNPDSYFQG